LAVARASGLQLKYFSASTLDPFADLVGIPFPVTDGDRKRLEFVRPDSVNNAELLFFDELNRAHPRVLNAVFELIQFRSINGEPLPHLRSVIAAINPGNAGYQVSELDPGLVDRFHLYLVFDGNPERDWFIEQFGRRVGRVLVDWFHAGLDEKQRAAVSNRRLEYIGRALRSGLSPGLAVPPDTKLPLDDLVRRLKEEPDLPDLEDFVADPAKYRAAVSTDYEIASRFLEVLPMMKPIEKFKVRDLLPRLFPEVLATIPIKCGFVTKKMLDAVRAFGSEQELEVYTAELNGKLAAASATLGSPDAPARRTGKRAA
jgi:MoxR-like ATPase